MAQPVCGQDDREVGTWGAGRSHGHQPAVLPLGQGHGDHGSGGLTRAGARGAWCARHRVSRERVVAVPVPEGQAYGKFRCHSHGEPTDREHSQQHTCNNAVPAGVPHNPPRHFDHFRASGKYLVAYMKQGGEKEYYLASACSEIYAPPSAYIGLRGFVTGGG